MKRLFGAFASRPAQTRPQNCAQTSIALALSIPVEAIERESGSTATLRLPDVRRLLERLGVGSPLMAADLVADYWPMYYRRYGGGQLRGYGIRTPRSGQPVGHAFALFGRRLYDPLTGQGTTLSASLLRERLDWIGFVDRSPEALRRLATLRARYRASTHGIVAAPARSTPPAAGGNFAAGFDGHVADGRLTVLRSVDGLPRP